MPEFQNNDYKAEIRRSEPRGMSEVRTDLSEGRDGPCGPREGYARGVGEVTRRILAEIWLGRGWGGVVR